MTLTVIFTWWSALVLFWRHPCASHMEALPQDHRPGLRPYRPPLPPPENAGSSLSMYRKYCMRCPGHPRERKMLNRLSESSLIILLGTFSFVQHNIYIYFIVQLLSCVQLCDPTDCSTPCSSVLHYFPEFAQTHVCLVSDLILCCPFLPSIFPSIRVFYNE